MEASENLWIATAIALAVGIIIGVVLAQISRRVSGGSSGSAQAQLESLQLRFEEYQQEVATHFKTTATLANRMNRSYQDIKDHLTHGALELAPDDMTRQRLLAALDQDAPAGNPSGHAGQEPAFDSLEPPRDYAPKAGDDPGTLSEEFGAKRKS